MMQSGRNRIFLPNLGKHGSLLNGISHCIVITLLFWVYATTCNGMEMLYPLYNYPNWWDSTNYVWDDVAGVSGVNLTTVINHNNGPGGPGAPNGDYVQGLTDLSAGGVSMLGYVYTDYGSRDLDTVKADIDQYYTDYMLTPGTETVIGGIFFDEASSSSDQAVLDYYDELYQYVHGYDSFNTVVLNHGTYAPEVYTGMADINLVFENTYTEWLDYSPYSYLASHSADQFAALVYDASSAFEMENAIDLAVARGIGNIFVTDDSTAGDNNPWDALPSYWLEESAYVGAATVPIPAAFVLLGSGLAGLVGIKRRMKN